MSGKLVLVTGATGFLASHVIRQLLEAGSKVRGTVRSLKDPQKHAALYALHPKGKENLELVEAELLEETCWAKAVKDVDYICHVASPVLSRTPESDNEIVAPARDGTMHVLKAAAQEKSVKRIVLTSSIAALAEPGCKDGQIKNESNWAQPADIPKISPYNKSKIIAERAAWSFYESLPYDSRFELTVVHPVLTFGPVLWAKSGTSLSFAKLMLENTVPYVLPMNYPVVDVRDVAKAHILCLTMPEAAGRRHLLFNRNVSVREICDTYRKEFGPQGYEVASEDITSDKFDQLCAERDMMARARLFWSDPMKLDNTRFTKVLGIDPIPMEKTLLDTAYSFIEFGLTKKTPEYKGPR